MRLHYFVDPLFGHCAGHISVHALLQARTEAEAKERTLAHHSRLVPDTIDRLQEEGKTSEADTASNGQSLFLPSIADPDWS